MTGEAREARAAWARAAAACAGAVQRLSQAHIAPDALAEFVPERRKLLMFRSPATMRPLGQTWRLGTLLLGTDGALYAHRASTRAAERGRPNNQSLSRERRREIAAAALRGGFAVGTSVDYDAELLLTPAGEPTPAVTGSGQSGAGSAAAPLDIPVGFEGGEVRVRWRTGAPLVGAPTLGQFLTERIDLVINPLLGRE